MVSGTGSAKTTVGTLLDAVNAAFADSFTLPASFLTDAYNHIAASIALCLPLPDAKLTAVAKDGKINTGLVPAQYRRVFAGERECLRGSETLCALLPDFPIYAPDDAGNAAVTESGTYTVYYRALPDAVTKESAKTAPLFPGETFLPLIRARLFAAVYRHIGDDDAAAAADAAADRELSAHRAAGEVCL